MSLVSHPSNAVRLREHASFARTLGWFVLLALIITVLMELMIRYSWSSTELSTFWVIPIRLVSWMLFLLAIVAWVFHGLNPPTAPKAVPVVEPVVPVVEDKSSEPATPEPTREVESRFHAVSPSLLAAEPIVGRTREREKLTEWIRAGTCSVLAITGRGGMGKTALAWLWLHHDVLGKRLEGQPKESKSTHRSCQLPEHHRPSSIFWASLEDGTPSFLMLLDELTDFFLVGKSSSVSLNTWAAKLDFVIDEMAQQSALVILDGFEHLLGGYAFPTALYHADRLSAVGERDARQCADPLAAEFLLRVSKLREGSRLILTTRQMPIECESGFCDDIKGADSIEIGGLEPNDCLSWMEQSSLVGDRVRFSVLARICSFRPLAIRLAIGMAKAEVRSPGDASAVIDHPLVAKNPNPPYVVRAAIASVDRLHRDLLSRLSAFRGTIDRADVEMISTVGKGASLDHAIADLVSRGLLQISADQKKYEMHPLVRAAAYERLPDVFGFHGILAGYYADRGDVIDPPKLCHLRTMIERYHHLAAANQFEPAREYFRDALSRQIIGKFADLPLAASLLRGLFGQGMSMPPTMEKGSSNAATVRNLSELLFNIGEPSQVTSLMRMAIKQSRSWNTKQTLDIDFAIEAEAHLRRGELHKASDSIQQCMASCNAAGEKFRISIARELQARLLLIEGQREEAITEVALAIDIVQSWDQPTLMARCLSTYAEILLASDRVPEGLEAAEQAQATCQAVMNGADIEPAVVVRTEGTFARSMIAAAKHHAKERESLLDQALDHVHAALRLLWRRGLYALEPEIRLIRAQIYVARDQSQTDRAIQEAMLALRLAKRYQAVLLQVDIHAFLASTYKRIGHMEKKQLHADQVREFAWCDGPPHCYKAALETVSTR